MADTGQRPILTRRLDKSVIKVAPVAVEAVNRTLQDIIAAQVHFLEKTLKNADVSAQTAKELEAISFALDETHHFMDKVDSDTTNKPEYARHLGVLHALDHVDRMMDCCREATEIKKTPSTFEKKRILEKLDEAIAAVRQWLADEAKHPEPQLQEISKSIADFRKESRVSILEAQACKGFDSIQTLKRLETLRWTDRAAYHVWRAAHHLTALNTERTDPPYPS